MSEANEAGKGDSSRVKDIFKYSERNDEIKWKYRNKKEENDGKDERVSKVRKTDSPKA